MSREGKYSIDGREGGYSRGREIRVNLFRNPQPMTGADCWAKLLFCMGTAHPAMSLPRLLLSWLGTVTITEYHSVSRIRPEDSRSIGERIDTRQHKEMTGGKFFHFSYLVINHGRTYCVRVAVVDAKAPNGVETVTRPREAIEKTFRLWAIFYKDQH